MWGAAAAMGIVALRVTWARPPAWYLLMASVGLLSLELLGPLLFAPLVVAADDALSLELGPWIRLAGVWGAATLAWIGLWASARTGITGSVSLPR